MGAWSHEPFGNDQACDWSGGLLETSDLSALEAALDAVVESSDGYLDADLAVEALAAIEVLAKLRGRGTQTDSYTKDVDQWVVAHPQEPSADLLAKAGAVIERIGSPESELLELWDDGKEADAWKASLRQLAAAMSAS